VEDEGLIVGKNQIPIDYEVLGKLQDHGADVLHTKNSIEANNHSTLTAMYYLLLKKKR
jgi:hypothetical protein